MQKRLCKSRTDKMIAGVCGGIANYLNCDPTIVRLITAALVLFVWYYPALSGLPIAAWRADLLNLLPSFGFY